MTLKNLRILMFAMCLALLTVVSARVSPAREDAAGPTEAELWPTPEPTPEPPPPTLEPTEEPVIDLEAELPGVDLNAWYLKLVNNDNSLSASFSPENVTAIRGGIYSQYFDSRAIERLEAMLDGAEAAGYEVYVRTAYRPYKSQATIFYGRATVISENQGIEYAEAEQMARKFVAYPGTSEHQLGLCADIMDSAQTPLDAEQAARLPLLLWLQEHCAEYGFIYRYPKEKQDITGWYEPWHFRYVGEDAARYMADKNLCLEEFYALSSGA